MDSSKDPAPPMNLEPLIRAVGALAVVCRTRIPTPWDFAPIYGAISGLAGGGDSSGIQMWTSPQNRALMVSEEVDGLTHRLEDSSARYYGGRHRVGEWVKESAGRMIASALGFEYVDDRKNRET